jgi:hypothetical protein
MHNQSGSAILTVVLLSSILVLLATTIIRNVSNITDIAIQREFYERHYYAFVGLLNYSKALGSFYTHELKSIGKKKIQVTLDSWQNHYKGMITFSSEKNGILVLVQMNQANNVLYSESYTINT